MKLQKEDLRRRNNTSANREMHIELDLWLRFVANDKKPVTIGIATSQGKYNQNKYTLFYAPTDSAKSSPYLLTFSCGQEFDSSRFETLASAKYHIKKSDPEVKWEKNKN